MVPVVGAEAYRQSPGSLISVPVSGSIPVPKQLGSSGARGLVETPPTVSDHAVLSLLV